MDENGKSRRITDVGWVGWALVISASASIAAASYNYGVNAETLQAMKDAVQAHNRNCEELHKAVQGIAIATQVLDARVSHLWDAHHADDAKADKERTKRK